MNNEELVKKMSDLLEKFRKETGELPNDKERKENLKGLYNHIEEDMNNEETFSAIYASNTGIGMAGSDTEIKALFASIIQRLLETGVLEDEDELVKITGIAVRTYKAEQNGTKDELLKESIEKLLNSMQEFLEN